MFYIWEVLPKKYICIYVQQYKAIYLFSSDKFTLVIMPFFNRTGLERIRVVEPEIGLLLGWSAGSKCGTTGLQSLDVALLYKDKKKRKGRRGLRPWSLRCLSQFLSERKDRLLKGRICCVPFTDGMAWYL